MAQYWYAAMQQTRRPGASADNATRLAEDSAATMPAKLLNAERQMLFNELIWRLMGNLQGSAWRELLDPDSRLGAAARRFYAQLCDAAAAGDPLALPVGAAVVLACSGSDS